MAEYSMLSILSLRMHNGGIPYYICSTTGTLSTNAVSKTHSYKQTQFFNEK